LLNVNYVALMETAEDDGSDDSSGAVALTSALSAAFVIASLAL